jgi:hypothetical protein
MAELLEGVEERAGPLDAGRRVDDLLAMHLAPAALQLILRPERYLRNALGREPLGRWLHDGILLPKSLRRKT